MHSATFLLTIAVPLVFAACSSPMPGGNAGGVQPPEDSGQSTSVMSVGPSSASALSSDGGVASVTGLVVDASNFSVTKNFDATGYSGVAGVQVCVYGEGSVPCATTDAICLYGQSTAPCAWTDASGRYTLAVPAGTAFTLSYNKAGYQPYLYAAGALGADTQGDAPAILITTTTSANAFLTMAGGTPDPTKGQILFGGGTTGPVPGAVYHETLGANAYYSAPSYSVTISPAATLGPVYESSTWAPDPS